MSNRKITYVQLTLDLIRLILLGLVSVIFWLPYILLPGTLMILSILFDVLSKFIAVMMTYVINLDTVDTPLRYIDRIWETIKSYPKLKEYNKGRK